MTADERQQQMIRDYLATYRPEPSVAKVIPLRPKTRHGWTWKVSGRPRASALEVRRKAGVG